MSVLRKRAATLDTIASSGIMVELQAYFDESGKLNDNGTHVVFGGLAGELDEVSVFSRKWCELLGSDVTHIHMKEAMHLRGPFRSLTETKRDEILVEAAKLAQRSSAMLIVSEMDKADFKALPLQQRNRLKDPTYGGFEGCIRALASEFSGHNFHIWYDESVQYAKTCLAMYQKMKSMYGNFARRLPSLTFADDEKYPGLQAADMIAYCAFVGQRDGSKAHKTVLEINSILHKESGGKGHLLYNRGASLGSGILEA